MTGRNEPTRPDRPLLPRDAFRAQRSSPVQAAITSVVVTPAYGDPVVTTAETPAAPPPQQQPIGAKAQAGAKSETRPFESYGQRSSSRPYALRLPDAIDLALRTIAAEEHTHPLRVIDRILYEHLKAMGRLPPVAGA